ncbi:MAG: nicotinic acid mononucleotide adenylyltransferase [Chitinophagaceae bacterium]
MKIGLYFGSFNPVHIGHLIIANHLLNESDLNKVWFIVSPQNPFKASSSLLNEYNRLHMVRLAIENDNRLNASNIEFHLPKPSYTVNTLTYLKEKYPQHEFFIIMGSDSFQNLDKWKNYEVIVKNYKIYIYKRTGFEVANDLNANIEIVEAPLLNISSTEIRKLIQQNKSIKYLVPEAVRGEIEAAGYYKNAGIK